MVKGKKALMPQEEKDLFIKYNNAGIEQSEKNIVREKLIVCNQGLIVSTVEPYASSTMPLDDLISCGNIGLMQAIDGFKPELGFKFSTYAVPCILGEVMNAVGDQARTIRVPRNVPGLINKLEELQEQGKLDESQKKQLAKFELLVRETKTISADRVFSPGELNEMGIDPEELLHDEVYSVENFLADKSHVNIDEEAISKKAKEEVFKVVFEQLDEREAEIVKLRFGLDDGDPKTFAEIGRIFHLSRERIRQIEKEALIKLRNPKRDILLKRIL